MKKIGLTPKKLQQKVSWLISIVQALLNNILKVYKNQSLQNVLILRPKFGLEQQFFFFILIFYITFLIS